MMSGRISVFSKVFCMPIPPAADQRMMAEIAPDTALIPRELAMIRSLVRLAQSGDHRRWQPKADVLLVPGHPPDEARPNGGRRRRCTPATVPGNLPDSAISALARPHSGPNIGSAGCL